MKFTANIPQNSQPKFTTQIHCANFPAAAAACSSGGAAGAVPVSHTLASGERLSLHVLWSNLASSSSAYHLRLRGDCRSLGKLPKLILTLVPNFLCETQNSPEKVQKKFTVFLPRLIWTMIIIIIIIIIIYIISIITTSKLRSPKKIFLAVRP